MKKRAFPLYITKCVLTLSVSKSIPSCTSQCLCVKYEFIRKLRYNLLRSILQIANVTNTVTCSLPHMKFLDHAMIKGMHCQRSFNIKSINFAPSLGAGRLANRRLKTFDAIAQKPSDLQPTETGLNIESSHVQKKLNRARRPSLPKPGIANFGIKGEQNQLDQNLAPLAFSNQKTSK